MKKELVTSLLVAVSMGVGVLGTNIYYDNVNSQPKTQIEQDQDKKEIKDAAKENKKEKEVKEETEKTDKESKQVIENKGTKETTKTDKESKQVIKNTETKETAKTNINNSQSKTENKESFTCPYCGKKMEEVYPDNYYCTNPYCSNCINNEDRKNYESTDEGAYDEEPVGDYWQIDPNNPNRVTNTNSGSGNSSGSGDSFRSTLQIQDFVE